VPQPQDDGQADDGQAERHRPQVLGVEERDDAEGPDVVGHRHRQQEQPQRRREGRPRDREHAQQEGGVGRDDDAPGPGRLARRVEDQEEQGRHGQARDRCHQRHGRALGVGEAAHLELSPQLQADDEEEEHHQAVVDPVPQVQRQLVVTEAQGELGVPEGLVGLAPGGVRPGQRQHGGGEEQCGGRGLPAQEAAQRCDLAIGVRGHGDSMEARRAGHLVP
jgi:hypothetical protein